jgi:glycosyltransferase involved in cell wall biosynthesis
MLKNNLSFIVITYQEERNIRACIESIKKVTNNIFVVDSYSSDKTQEILAEMDVNYCEHEFISYADKRNWSQSNNPFNTEWVFHLDADERVSDELSNWLLKDFGNLNHNYDGFMFSRRVIFMGKQIKYGGIYPNYHLNLFRSDKGYVENLLYDSNFVVEGNNVKEIKKADIINTVSPSLEKFIVVHNKWSSLEADEIFKGGGAETSQVEAKIFGNSVERIQWAKKNIYSNFPLTIRSLLFFLYRYIFRLGFLDGRRGFIFHFLQGFWYRFLVDAKIYELELKDEKS